MPTSPPCPERVPLITLLASAVALAGLVSVVWFINIAQNRECAHGCRVRGYQDGRYDMINRCACEGRQ